MIRTETDHTVTLRRPDPETGEVVAVDVTVKRGNHSKGSDEDFNAALDWLWSAGLAVDPDRAEPEPEDLDAVDDDAPEPKAKARRKPKAKEPAETGTDTTNDPATTVADDTTPEV